MGEAKSLFREAFTIGESYIITSSVECMLFGGPRAAGMAASEGKEAASHAMAGARRLITCRYRGITRVTH